MCSVLFQVTATDIQRYLNFFPSLETVQAQRELFFRPWTDFAKRHHHGGSTSIESGREGTFYDTLQTADKKHESDSTFVSGGHFEDHQSTSDISDSAAGNDSDNSNIGSGTTCSSESDGVLSYNPIRRRRKPNKPRRGAAPNDPSFRGVTVSVQTELARRKWTRKLHTRLLIKSYFSVRRVKGLRELRRRRFRQLRICYPSSSDSSDGDKVSPSREIQHNTVLLGTKQCASCGTRRTPLWRDAEDGTPLCNACGIRYKKYRLRCIRCWFIPRKDSKTYPNCARCGLLLRVAILRK